MNEDALVETLKTGRSAAVLSALSEISPKERIALLRLAVRKISFGKWPNEYLDEMITLGDAAIADALAIQEKDEANMICYNMSANLADCWNDAYTRARHHF